VDDLQCRCNGIEAHHVPTSHDLRRNRVGLDTPGAAIQTGCLSVAFATASVLAEHSTCGTRGLFIRRITDGSLQSARLYWSPKGNTCRHHVPFLCEGHHIWRGERFVPIAQTGKWKRKAANRPGS